jgi:hypothetical protein
MPTIKPSGKILGASVEELDLSKPLSQKDRVLIFCSLGMYGVLHFPKQSLDAASLKSFSQRFGTLEVHIANIFQEPRNPEHPIQHREEWKTASLTADAARFGEPNEDLFGVDILPPEQSRPPVRKPSPSALLGEQAPGKISSTAAGIARDPVGRIPCFPARCCHRLDWPRCEHHHCRSATPAQRS